MSDKKDEITQYAVMVPFECGWLYVTEGSEAKVVTYNKKWEAENASKIFKESKVVEYMEANNELR